jgi:hypothetical protein
MANELKHGTVGTELTQAEWEGIGTHVVANQAVGDIVYADTTSQLLRLGIGSTNEVLRVTSGKPDWQATTFITGLGTVTTGVWQGTDVGVAYGGTGVSTLTANGVLIGNGTSAIGAVDMSTKGHLLIGDGSGNPQMLGVGTNTHVLTADSGETTGVKWAASVSQATQAAIEAETNEDTYAPPDLIKHSPGVAKVWVRWEQTGAHSILASYNMTSVTDGGAAGDTDHLWDTDFSGAEYVLTAMSREDRAIGLVIGSLAATGVTTLNPNLAGTAYDSDDNMMAGFGDQ